MSPASIPDGDILVHAGDLTNAGTIPDIQRTIDWIAELPHPHKVCIAGNHDTYLDPRTRPSLDEPDRTGSLDWKGIRYLQHSTASITVRKDGYSRTLQVYGAPQIPTCGPPAVFAFQYPPESDAWSGTVPENTNILVTHTPPKTHLDISLPDGMGCPYLLEEVRRVKPMLHVFGHVHWGAGKEIAYWDGSQGAYERGLMRKGGWFMGLLDVWLWVEVAKVAVYGTKRVVWERVWGGEDALRKATRMVNAAQMHGNTGKLGNKVQYVDI
jgi:hypothetical protein